MRKLIFFIVLITSTVSFTQTKDELDLCMAIQANSFSTNTEADDALERILDVIGASKNFVLTPCDKISNAVATAYKGTRYILYDKEFMNLISKNTNDWSNLFIFAHEVGHHINGHSIDLLLYTNDVVDAPSLEKSRKQELEADEFAAFVLAKLGANLTQLNNVITLISDNSDDTYSTHPKRSRRLESVKVGFGKGIIKKNTESNVSKSNRRYFDEFNEKAVIKRVGSWFTAKSKNPFAKRMSGSFVKAVNEDVFFVFSPRPKNCLFNCDEYSIVGLKNVLPKILFDYSLMEIDTIPDSRLPKYYGGGSDIEISIMNSLGERILNLIGRTNLEERVDLTELINSKGVGMYLFGNDYKLKSSLIEGNKFYIKLTPYYHNRIPGSSRGSLIHNYGKIYLDKSYILEFSLSGSSKALAN